MTNLYRPEDKLPRDGQYVLVHRCQNNWHDEDDPAGMNWCVMKFVRGITKEERKAMPNCLRKRQIHGADEHGNNKRPYAWYEFGPSKFFGQNIDYWCELPTLPESETN